MTQKQLATNIAVLNRCLTKIYLLIYIGKCQGCFGDISFPLLRFVSLITSFTQLLLTKNVVTSLDGRFGETVKCSM